MSGKTPGQAAFEEHGDRIESGYPDDWDDNLSDSERADWEAIAAAGAAGAHERTAELLSEVNRVTAERDAFRSAAQFELDRHTDVSLHCFDCGELLWLTSADAPTLGDVIEAASQHKCDDEPAPAIVTAGAEHLAAELAEEGR
jgi:hypothetical protein